MKRKYWFSEKRIFTALLLLNLLPICCGKFFPTLDGAAHLYNSQLINTLLFDGHNVVKNFFKFNPELVPNWSGHFILSLFNSFLPAYVAEKILLIFYLIAFPLSFRALLKVITPNNTYLSMLIFPFTYSFMLFLGFYNFSIGVVMALLTLTFWLKFEDKKLNLKQFFILTTLFLLTYFSHIFIFGALIFILVTYCFFSGFLNHLKDKKELELMFIDFVKKVYRLVLTVFIPLTFLLVYFVERVGEKTYQFINKKELFEWTLNIRSLIAFNISKEEKFTYPIFVVLVLLTFVVLFLRIKSKTRIVVKRDVWLIISVFLLGFYFFMPDSNGVAGFISVRFQYLFFVFLVLWIALQKIPKVIGYTAVTLVVMANLILNVYYFKDSRKHNLIANECYNTASYIQPNSIVLPINNSNQWLFGHFSNYLGVDKPIVILENYECATKYFPILWNEIDAPNTTLGNKNRSKFLCLWWLSNENNPQKKIDYVFVLGDPTEEKDSCTARILKEMKRSYRLIKKTKNTHLFQLR